MTSPEAVQLAARNPRFWLAGFLAIFMLGLGLATVHQTDVASAPPVSASASLRLQPVNYAVQDAMPDAAVPAHLYKFALNAFLMPLLDDSVPPRWTDVAVEYGCGSGTSVMVDGQPMIPGTSLPTRAFTVRWVMDECTPFGQGSVRLSGGIELVVSHKHLGLHAVVNPDHLSVDSHMGRAWLRGPFNAEASLPAAARAGRSKTLDPR